MNATLASYAALAGALIVEAIGSALLLKTEHFTKLLPSLGTLACYAVAIHLLVLALEVQP